jgi:MFS family permease
MIPEIEVAPEPQPEKKASVRNLPRNVWAVSLTSFFMDVSSEMVLNILPLFLANVLGVRTSVIGLIEGVAEATSSILKLSKPFFLFATTWEAIAAVRWVDRVGKGIRTAPRDALIADSIDPKQRGLAFGFHRAADTAGALVGLLIAIFVVWLAQAGSADLSEQTFRAVVVVSLIPAVLAVISLAFGAKDVTVKGQRAAPKFAFRALGRPFMIFMVIVGIFTLGNSSDAFLVLRAQDLGVNVIGILAMVATFNLIYALISTPAGSLSDRIGRRKLIVGGWLVYALIYLGFGLAQTGWQVWVLYALYGGYYGMAYGTANALVADLVPAELRGTAYGSYNAIIGLLAFPASVIAGVLWQGVGAWSGFGPSAPFIFGGTLALIAAVLMAFWMPRMKKPSTN